MWLKLKLLFRFLCLTNKFWTRVSESGVKVLEIVKEKINVNTVCWTELIMLVMKKCLKLTQSKRVELER